jgi:hypothetical protein
MKSEINFEKCDVNWLDTSRLTSSHVITIGVDIGNLPAHKATEFLQAHAATAKKAFEPARIVVYPKGSTEFNVEQVVASLATTEIEQ